ncbi:MAG: RsbRD N-terminal domain-containing protein [Elusimicrobiota bacterium]
MALNDLLANSKKDIVGCWFDKTIRSYRPETARFLKREKDSFSNPVGSHTAAGLEEVFDALCADGEKGSALRREGLERIIKIRSVQDFTPAQAVAFVFQLKSAVRETLAGALRSERILSELAGLDARIDGLALEAFDVYMRCRERLHEIKTGEIKRQSQVLFERAGGPCAMAEKGNGSCGQAGENCS